MNRYDEYTKLKNELAQPPQRLEETLHQAMTRYARHKKLTFLWRTPMVSLSFLAALFILLVNLSPTAALAMSDIPILKSFVKAVAFDPSLKIAVENDYVQYVGDRQTKEGIHVTVDYMIVDANHISLFFRVDSPNETGIYNFQLLDATGLPLPATLVYDTGYEKDQMEEIKVDMAKETPIPKELFFDINITETPPEKTQTVTVPGDSGIWSSETENTEDTSAVSVPFHFVLKPEDKFIQSKRTATIDEWIEVFGQRIYLDRLEIYPSKTTLIIETDETNSAAVRNLNLYFEDEKGKLYNQKSSGVTATFQPDGINIGSIWFESSYFALAKHLTLNLTGVSLIEKDKQYGIIDYAHKTISNLPEEVTVEAMELDNKTLTFTLNVAKPLEIISSQYYDIHDNLYNFGTFTFNTYQDKDKNTIMNANYRIAPFIDNYYKVEWHYAPEKKLSKPIEINIKASE